MSIQKLGRIAIYGAVASISGAFVLHHYTQANLASGGYYQLTIDVVKNHQQTNDILGSPLRFAYMNLGRRDIQITKDKAQIVVPIKGSKRSGNVFSKSSKKNERWHLDHVEVEVNQSGGRRIKILSDEQSPTNTE
ncbi:uncharacterized protein LOC114525655 [Dendronephthya gigantea]|uniref:uncharacterized protein LOC114525655 n=1 Tax=Dendronephthya gigantea TaxID=151771 RepID=UPI00106D955E|nr:uncharacterized protein LOC114525655 [Dendronephthya gigantea]